jgi:hypothetical protein
MSEPSKPIIELDNAIINLDEKGKEAFFFNDPPHGAFAGRIDAIKYLVKNHGDLYFKRLEELNLTINDDIWNL